MAGRPPDEAELVRAAQGGDDGAFALLLRPHATLAYRTALLACADAGEAEDATQEAFVKAHRALRRFRTGQPFRPWLLAIVANEARNRRRAGGRREHLQGRAGQAFGEGAAPLSPEQSALDRERRAVLLGGLSGLREDDRLIIGCRFLLDLSEAETAQALGVRPGTVKSRLSRALERLREVVGDEVRA